MTRTKVDSSITLTLNTETPTPCRRFLLARTARFVQLHCDGGHRPNRYCVLFSSIARRTGKLSKKAVICLTEASRLRPYSRVNTVRCQRICEDSMSRKHKENEVPLVTLKNESSRQRWEMFHRAIAHAKETNQAAIVEADLGAEESSGGGPLLTIVR
jgi:hypothetical protein